jgi:hypothetical protein
MVNGSKSESNKNGGRENLIAKIKSPHHLNYRIPHLLGFLYFITSLHRGWNFQSADTSSFCILKK